jgi:hypothetical protein
MTERPVRRSAVNTPLCPAGHLPHKGGDWLGAAARSTLVVWPRPFHDSISPLVGEMSGRTEGGATPAVFHALTNTYAEA